MSVLIYTKPNCVNCEKTKNEFKSLNISYDEIDITKDKEALMRIKQAGFREAPVIFTENDSWSGFNPEKIRAINSDGSDDDLWA